MCDKKRPDKKKQKANDYLSLPPLGVGLCGVPQKGPEGPRGPLCPSRYFLFCFPPFSPSLFHFFICFFFDVRTPQVSSSLYYKKNHAKTIHILATYKSHVRWTVVCLVAFLFLYD